MLDIPLLILIAPLSAFLIGLVAVPAVRRAALARGFVDSPDLRRKLHAEPIALGGGIAVWLATWCGWFVSLLLSSRSATAASASAGATAIPSDSLWFLSALALSSFLILCLGVIDDRRAMRGRHKLAGQVLAAVILVGLGIRIDTWRCFGIELQLGIFAYPVTILWVLLCINAFNLIDGMDGFCGSLGVVASLTIAFLAYWHGQVADALIGLSLAGALAAFLRSNLPPAKIYLGDAGSMTIGLMLSALSVRACVDARGTAVSLLPVVALLTLPLLDVVTAAFRRWLKGRSMFMADRGHLHHCLKVRLRSTVAALVVAASLAALGAAGAALALTRGVGDHIPFLAIAISIGLLVCTNTFGATELRLLLFRLKVALKSLPSFFSVGARNVTQECHLGGKRDWADLWDELVREGEASGVWRIELAIDLAATGEVYHGHWTLPIAEDEPHWSIVHNLKAGNTVAGTISMAGNVEACGSPYLDKVEKLVRVVESRLVSAPETVLDPANESSTPSGTRLRAQAMT
jgi:UDP-GlcNAc:undecaprenyl-phosphate/decaprenyl-phosphate GlcNAc-1-phosphate transferase